MPRYFILLFFFFLHHAAAYYSRHYRKCVLRAKGFDIGSLQLERIPHYDAGFSYLEKGNSTLQVSY